jgi:hypothetical protein
MREQLERIIKDCLEEGIKVQCDLFENGSTAYRVDGFSKSGEALLYAEENAIMCKTRYNRVDHILTFKDLAYIAWEWYENYKDREPFQNPDPDWKRVFEKLNIRNTRINQEEEDLPF